MRHRWSGIAREVHFFSSLALCLLLLFFGVTGFMANHRGWFHEHIDRQDLAPGEALDRACGVEALRALGGKGEPSRSGRWWFMEGPSPDQRLGCREGSEVVHVGRVEPWPDGVAREVDAFREDWLARVGRRLDEWSPGGERSGWWLRHRDPRRILTWKLEPERGRVVVWERPLPWAFQWIEMHRGRGSTALLVDVTAVLTVMVALSGVAFGLRYPGRRRRVLAALVVLSAVGLGILLAG